MQVLYQRQWWTVKRQRPAFLFIERHGRAFWVASAVVTDRRSRTPDAPVCRTCHRRHRSYEWCR